ncbi:MULTISPECIES: hypothetical protein [Pseudomonadota]|jgi:hypothetical protein|nr:MULTISPECIES: hypothetical protein [Pseudomonadota]
MAVIAIGIYAPIVANVLAFYIERGFMYVGIALGQTIKPSLTSR